MPAGNRRKCKAGGCHSLASKDGFCVKHRPQHLKDIYKAEAAPPVVRDNYMEYGGYNGQSSFFNDSYGIVRDDYEIEHTYGWRKV